MKNTEYRDATAALRRVTTLRQQRSETVRVAVGSVFAWMGAQRVLAACAGGTDGASDMRLIRLLADLEAATDRLDAIPSRGRTLPQRGQAWADILDRVAYVQRHLQTEEALARAVAS